MLGASLEMLLKMMLKMMLKLMLKLLRATSCAELSRAGRGRNCRTYRRAGYDSYAVDIECDELAQRAGHDVKSEQVRASSSKLEQI